MRKRRKCPEIILQSRIHCTGTQSSSSGLQHSHEKVLYWILYARSHVNDLRWWMKWDCRYEGTLNWLYSGHMGYEVDLHGTWQLQFLSCCTADLLRSGACRHTSRSSSLFCYCRNFFFFLSSVAIAHVQYSRTELFMFLDYIRLQWLTMVVACINLWTSPSHYPHWIGLGGRGTGSKRGGREQC